MQGHKFEYLAKQYLPTLFARAVKTFLYVSQPFGSRDVKSFNFFFVLLGYTRIKFVLRILKRRRT